MRPSHPRITPPTHLQHQNIRNLTVLKSQQKNFIGHGGTSLKIPKKNIGNDQEHHLDRTWLHQHQSPRFYRCDQFG